MDQKKPLRPHKCLQINSCFILPLFPHLPRVPLIFPSISPSPVPMSPCVQEPTLHFFLTLKPITSLQNSVQLEKPCHQPLLMQFSLISSFYAFYQILFIAETPFLFCPFPSQLKLLAAYLETAYLTLRPAKALEMAACL